MTVYGRPCPHGHPPGTCKACREAVLKAVSRDRDADVGAQEQARTRLLARMAGNIAAGVAVHLREGAFKTSEEVATAVAPVSVAIARAILEELER